MNTTDKPASHRLITGTASITLGAVPDAQSIQTLKQQGITHVITLQTSSEHAEQVERLVKDAGMHWRWFPFTETLDSTETGLELLRQYIQELGKLTTEGKQLYFHCNDARSRCMLLIFALLHHRRIPSSSAYPMLHDLSSGSANRLSRAELQWAASLGLSVH